MAERLDDASRLAAALELLAQCDWIEGDHPARPRPVLRRAIALYDVDRTGGHAYEYGFDFC